MKRKITKWQKLRWMIARACARPSFQAALAESVKKNEELLARLRKPR